VPAVWTSGDLVAVDLEGSGPQDPAGEAILEIALVPIRAGLPEVTAAYSTVINPERPIRRGPWTSPGLTNATLTAAPPLSSVAASIRERVDGRILVGHNVTVDWRLIHTHLPDARPRALIDTLRLARHRRPDLKNGHSLSAWIERLHLSDTITAAAPGSQPHRAIWDALATAELLRALMHDAPVAEADLEALLTIAGIPTDRPARRQPSAASPDQPGLWDLP
jgi:DNA polymerase III epsilon subunit-like protein